MKTTAEKIELRLPVSLCAQLPEVLAAKNITLDQFVNEAVSEYVRESQPEKPAEPVKAREWWIIPGIKWLLRNESTATNDAAWCEETSARPLGDGWRSLGIHVREVMPGDEDLLTTRRALAAVMKERDELRDALIVLRDKLRDAAECDREAIEIGRKWLTDSSLEKWFPLSHKEMEALRAELDSVREENRIGRLLAAESRAKIAALTDEIEAVKAERDKLIGSERSAYERFAEKTDALTRVKAERDKLRAELDEVKRRTDPFHDAPEPQNPAKPVCDRNCDCVGPCKMEASK